jgi:hypothetical protein
MNRKTLKLFVLSAALLLVPTAVVQAQFTFTTNNGAITITGYTGSNSVVVIPDTTNGYPVTSIGTEAFFLSSMTAVTIPDSVNNIGIYAFQACSSLTSVIIPNSVTNIGSGAFVGCGSLTNAVISTNLTYLVDNLFAFSGLKNFVIPVGITNIGASAFDNCTQLTNVVIPTNVFSIGGYAFDDCHTMTSVTIPDSVSTLGSWAFAGGYNVTGLTIGNGITHIPGDAFAFDTSLKSVTIPDSVTNIAGAAFDGCSSLASITYGGGIGIDVGNLRFVGVNNLNTIVVASNNLVLSSLDGVLFDKNQDTLIQCPIAKVGSYVIPDSVTNIWSPAFVNCSALTDIELGNGLTAVNGSLFNGCSSLTNVTVSDSVTNVWVGSFSYCPVLNSITVSPNNPAYSSMNGVLFDKNRTELIQYPNGRTGSYTIPSGITYIGYTAFYSCAGLTSVTIPNGITSILDATFDDCINLTNVTIPGTVTNIGFMAIANCGNLRSIYFGGNAPSVDPTAFQNGINPDPFSNEPPYIYEVMPVVYYLPWATGWSTNFGGLPTAVWLPTMQFSNSRFGVLTNYFGFNINWASGQTVVVEACANLSAPVWQPVETNTLTTGAAYFSDPHWTNYSGRFYRIRSP